MALIQILPSALSDQIAAGEVVERPSSVAKELLENALDAGATRITVDFELGGVKRLRIVDNGLGMTTDDAVLSVRRHATSKIGTLDDLNNIDTLGFRGEALASIASVSKFRLRTKQAGELSATLVNVKGGAEPSVSEIGGPVGTEVVVQDLFYNVPARRKFLKKTETESTHIVETTQRLALCYPNVAFKVIRDGKSVLELPVHHDLTARLSGLFPKSVTRGVRSLSVPGAFGLSGVIGAPEDARGSTRHYYLFVNGRIVKDRVMMSAIQSGCGHLLSKGKHPFAVVSLNLPALAVDVNVHPAKTEVRFADSRQIFRLIARTVESALMRTSSSLDELSASKAVPSVSGLQVKRLVEQGIKPVTPPSAQGLVTQKRRVFDAMARLAQKQHTRGVKDASVGQDKLTAPARPEPGYDAPRPNVDIATEQAGLFEHSRTIQNIEDGSSSHDVLAVAQSAGFAGDADNATTASCLLKDDDSVGSIRADCDGRNRCEALSKLTPVFEGDGLVLFSVSNGLKMLDVSLLNQLIYKGRRQSRAYCPVELRQPILIESGHAGRTQRLLESLNAVGFVADAFGATTARVTGCDASVLLGDSLGQALQLLLPQARTELELEQCALRTAAGVSVRQWSTVLEQSSSHIYLDDVIQTLTSGAVR